MISTSRSFSGGSTHHRKSSSKIKGATAAPAFSSRFANTNVVLEEQEETVAAKKYAFAGSDSFRAAGIGMSTPTQERLGAILEDGVPASKADVTPTRSTPSAIRTSPVRHRISPSLPYGPYDSKTAPSPTPLQASPLRLTPQNVALSVLRRVRYLDLLYLIVFGGCLLVFFGALGGVGYSGTVTLPLQTPEPVTMPMIRPPIIMPGRPGQAPLVIKEDPEELAREEAERPVFARGRAPVFAQQPEAPKYAAPIAPPVLRRPVQPVIAQPHPPLPLEDEQPLPETEDQGPELVSASPNDQRLDDDHAAHYHHPPDTNVYRARARDEAEVVPPHHADDEDSHRIVTLPIPTSIEAEGSDDLVIEEQPSRPRQAEEEAETEAVYGAGNDEEETDLNDSVETDGG